MKIDLTEKWSLKAKHFFKDCFMSMYHDLSLIPIAMSPTKASPKAKGAWIKFPIKVFLLAPTNSTLKPNANKKHPWAPETQCGNFMIFLSLRFYVKSNLRILRVQNLTFLLIWRLWILIFMHFCALCEVWNWPKIQLQSLQNGKNWHF